MYCVHNYANLYKNYELVQWFVNKFSNFAQNL